MVFPALQMATAFEITDLILLVLLKHSRRCFLVTVEVELPPVQMAPALKEIYFIFSN